MTTGMTRPINFQRGDHRMRVAAKGPQPPIRSRVGRHDEMIFQLTSSNGRRKMETELNAKNIESSAEHICTIAQGLEENTHSIKKNSRVLSAIEEQMAIEQQNYADRQVEVDQRLTTNEQRLTTNEQAISQVARKQDLLEQRLLAAMDRKIAQNEHRVKKTSTPRVTKGQTHRRGRGSKAGTTKKPLDQHIRNFLALGDYATLTKAKLDEFMLFLISSEYEFKVQRAHALTLVKKVRDSLKK